MTYGYELVVDLKHRDYYQYAERNLADFLKRRRDDIFLISKGWPKTQMWVQAWCDFSHFG